MISKAHAAFGLGRGLCGVRGVLLNLPSPLMTFFEHICYRHSPHTDISNVGGHLACGLFIKNWFQELVFQKMLKKILYFARTMTFGHWFPPHVFLPTVFFFPRSKTGTGSLFRMWKLPSFRIYCRGISTYRVC